MRRMTLVMKVLKGHRWFSHICTAQSGKDTHRDPTANMDASPIFCCIGIFNLMTIGMGITKMKRSVTILLTAVAT